MDHQIRKNRLLHKVEHHGFLERDHYGDSSYKEPYTFDCYRDEKIEIVKNLDGEEVVSSTKLYVDGVLDLNKGDKFIVDGESSPLLAFSRYDGLKKGKGTTVIYI